MDPFVRFSSQEDTVHKWDRFHTFPVNLSVRSDQDSHNSFWSRHTSNMVRYSHYEQRAWTNTAGRFPRTPRVGARCSNRCYHWDWRCTYTWHDCHRKSRDRFSHLVFPAAPRRMLGMVHDVPAAPDFHQGPQVPYTCNFWGNPGRRRIVRCFHLVTRASVHI